MTINADSYFNEIKSIGLTTKEWVQINKLIAHIDKELENYKSQISNLRLEGKADFSISLYRGILEWFTSNKVSIKVINKILDHYTDCGYKLKYDARFHTLDFKIPN